MTQVNLMNLTKPVVMGILNATPDSFYNKGRASNTEALLAKASQMITDGATILDIGGMSTRPNSEEISIDAELKRVVPVIEAVRKMHADTLISIDTYRSQVAEAAIEAGAHVINDVSGGHFDARIIAVAAKCRKPYICMHMQGNPRTMQKQPHYNNVVQDVMHYFTERVANCHSQGLEDVILDVGFGFGKTIEHNYDLLKHMSQFKTLGKPILAGISRKSMIYKPLGLTAEEALNGTTALHMIALQQGAMILRVHDVKEAMECIELTNLLND